MGKWENSSSGGYKAIEYQVFPTHHQKIVFAVLSSFLFSFFFIFLSLQMILPAGAYGESKISSLMKSAIYFEMGEYQKAYNKIKVYESELTESAIANTIKAITEKNEKLLQESYKIVPEIEEKIRDRMEYERAKILFMKGDLSKSKEILLELRKKEEYEDSSNFMLTNINLVEGKEKVSAKILKNVDRKKIDKVKYRELESAVSERTSDIYVKSRLSTSLFFSTRGAPIVFEEDRFLKTWDIISELGGTIKAEFLKSREINPFVMYSAEGEFYTELDGIFIQNISVGGEYNAWIFPVGLQYNLVISTLGSRIFSTRHEISPYFFPTGFIFTRLKVGFETRNEIDEREGSIISVQGGGRYERKLGNITAGGIFLLDIGKRFARTGRFSELFVYPYLEVFSKVGAFTFFISSYANTMLFPEDFDGRTRNILWLVSPGVSFSGKFLRWDILRVSVEGNASDRFGWTRVKLGTSFWVEF